MAIELVLMALIKSPKKAKLIHLLAELYLMVGDKDMCIKYAEKALVYLPQNSDLRNLLLQVQQDYV